MLAGTSIPGGGRGVPQYLDMSCCLAKVASMNVPNPFTEILIRGSGRKRPKNVLVCLLRYRSVVCGYNASVPPPRKSRLYIVYGAVAELETVAYLRASGHGAMTPPRRNNTNICGFLRFHISEKRANLPLALNVLRLDDIVSQLQGGGWGLRPLTP